MIIQPQHSSNGNAESIDNDGDETMATTTRTVKLTHHNGFSQEFGLVQHQQKTSPKHDHDNDQQDVAQVSLWCTFSGCFLCRKRYRLVRFTFFPDFSKDIFYVFFWPAMNLCPYTFGSFKICIVFLIFSSAYTIGYGFECG
jgi:hypothetical protein